MKALVFGATLLIGITVSAIALAAGPSKEPLRVLFFPTKTSLRVGEVLEGIVLVENTGSTPARVPAGQGGGLCSYARLSVRLPNGEIQQFKCLLDIDFFGPIESTVVIPVGKLYGMRVARSLPKLAGKYGVRAEFMSPRGKYPYMVLGNYSSPWLDVEVGP